MKFWKYISHSSFVTPSKPFSSCCSCKAATLFFSCNTSINSELNPLKNVQIFKGNVKCKTFFTLMYVQKKYYFLMTFFRHVLTILAWIKCRLVSKHVLSSTHFHSCFFLTFPVKFYIYKIFKSSIKEYLVLAILFLFYKYQLEQFRKWHEVRIKL